MRPGGTLVYITCSVLDEENSRQVAAFLAGHADFDMVPMAPLLESLHPGAENRAHVGPYGVLLTPLRTGTDGFFVSLMRRLPGL